jgi:hypothetical protein
MVRWTGHVARIGETRNVCNVSVGKLEEKRPLGRPRLRWEDNTRVIGWEGVDWIHLAQDRDQLRALVNAVMNLRNP